MDSLIKLTEKKSYLSYLYPTNKITFVIILDEIRVILYSVIDN
jgi:hypothetical protein